MALTSLVTSLRLSTFLTSGNPRLSMAVINVHASPPTVSRISMAVINIQAAPPTVSRLSQVHIDTWVSLDQAFYAGEMFGGGEVFAPDFFVEPIFESPEPPEIEVNPYRAAEPNTDLQQILREQHNVTQAGDSTFHWGVLTDIYNEPLYNLGSLGKFYHDDLGIIHARYCRFVDFNLTDARATPVGLRKPRNLPWTVTNQLSLSHPDAVIGVALPYDNKVNIGTWYGWVVTEGFLPAEVPVAISNKKFPFGTEYGWSANGTIAQELDSVSLGYRVRIDNDPRMQPGAFYVQTDRSSLGRANGLITTRLAPLVSDIEGLDTRLTTLEGTVAGHTIEIGAINQRHTDFVTFMTKEVKNLSDALNAIRALMPDGNFKTYVDTSIANMKGYVDANITVVGGVANAALIRANEAWALANSISYAGIQTQIDAINNAMGGITNRIIGFKTTIDTNTLTAGQVLISVLDSTDVDGVNYYSFHPIDFLLGSLTDVDLTTTPPVHGDSLVYDGVNNKWVPFAVSGGGGGGGVPEAPTDGLNYVRNNAAWVTEARVRESFNNGQANTGAFGARGGALTPLRNCVLHTLFAKFTADPAVTYQAYVVTLTGSTVATIVDSVTIGPGLVNTAYWLHAFTFATPVNLTAGTSYGILFVRNTTSGSTAWAMQGTGGAGILYTPGFAVVDTYLRGTFNTVAVAQVYSAGSNSYWFGCEFL